MDKVSVVLRVFFEDPFWIGILERVESGRMTVCKITFGPETLEELPDGDFMFTAGYSDKENLFCWILSLGDQIELLEPCEFRGELAELGRRVYEIYR